MLGCLSATAASATIAHVKTIAINSTKASAGTSIAVTVPAAGVAAGNSIILTFAMDEEVGTVSATDSKGNIYTADASVAANGVRTVILAAHNVLALTSGNTITVTHPSVTARALAANEFSGILTPSPLDRTKTAVGTGTVPSS
ncbi:MAG: hypothetical protein SF182_18395, partial [Deltaproteobacteria bacterium]|nr:hypothetical protein [Deltaproteobacteria bacterium]